LEKDERSDAMGGNYENNPVEHSALTELLIHFQLAATFYLLQWHKRVNGQPEAIEMVIDLWKKNAEAAYGDVLQEQDGSYHSALLSLFKGANPTASEVHQKLDQLMADAEIIIRQAVDVPSP
jgi:hypothetical protein